MLGDTYNGANVFPVLLPGSNGDITGLLIPNVTAPTTNLTEAFTEFGPCIAAMNT